MLKSLIRVLVVDDFESWRRFHCSALQKESNFQVVGEVSDGLEAVQKAQQLQPDLILLDIGLPSLNGIEAARRIRQISANSKILFVSENRSADIVNEALNTGAVGYVLKFDVAGELLRAVRAVLEGGRFVSTSVASHGLSSPPDPQSGARLRSKNIEVPIPSLGVASVRYHEVGFYSEDRHFLDHVTQFIAAALMAGNAAIIAATESHRKDLLSRLRSQTVEIDAAIEQGRLIVLDAAETLSEFMVNDMPNPVRFLELLGDLIVAATEAANAERPRVFVFGESVHLLWAQGNAEAAIQMERLGNKLTKIHNVDILCGYSLASTGRMDEHIFRQICAEHSAVHLL